MTAQQEVYTRRIREFIEADEREKLNIAEAAKAASVQRATIFVWLKNGLPSVSIGAGSRRPGRRYTLKSWLVEWMAKHQFAPSGADEDLPTTGGSAAVA